MALVVLLCMCALGGMDKVIITSETSGEVEECIRPVRKKYDGGWVPVFLAMQMDLTLKETGSDLLSKARVKRI